MTAPLAPARAPPARGTAVVIWAALVGLLAVSLAMVLAVERPADDPQASRTLILWAAVVATALGVALSRLLPRRIPARHTGGRPGTNAFVRFLVAWGLCEVAALLPLLAHMLVHDHRLLLLFALGLVGLLGLYPGRDAWALLAAEKAAPAPERTGR
jgi:hypothetical protein